MGAPAAEAIGPQGGEDEESYLRKLEFAPVELSLKNLMTFPFVRQAVDEERLTLHGLWNDTGEGALQQFDPARGFVSV